MATPYLQHKNPCPAGDDTFNISRIFLVHYYCTLSSPALRPRVEKAFHLKYMYGHVQTQVSQP